VISVVRILAPNPRPRELEGTNTWVVGRRDSIVIDPGPDDEGHLCEVAREAGRVGAILLTHAHADHAKGARSLAEMTGATVFGFRPPAGGRKLRDGQDFEVGGATVHVLGTPGHSPDHVAFFLDDRRALFTGDAVLGRGRSVIVPPGGELVAHLRSLRRMRELSPRTIHPGHGPVVLYPAARLDECLEDLAMLEERVIAALAARPLLGHLMKLESEGRVQKRTKGGVARWSVCQPRHCARCGRPVKGRARLCGPCSLAVLQE
jgi:glyoxylase-like metal-dependent hydrolase (beta-lactamase superfamily II)